MLRTSDLEAGVEVAGAKLGLEAALLLQTATDTRVALVAFAGQGGQEFAGGETASSWRIGGAYSTPRAEGGDEEREKDG